jgi:hypothetical protein
VGSLRRDGQRLLLTCHWFPCLAREALYASPLLVALTPGLPVKMSCQRPPCSRRPGRAPAGPRRSDAQEARSRGSRQAAQCLPQRPNLTRVHDSMTSPP